MRRRRAAAASRTAEAGPALPSAWCARVPARRWPPASPACGAARRRRRHRCGACPGRSAGGTTRTPPQRIHRRPSRPSRPQRRTRRRPPSWRRGGSRHRAPCRSPAPAAGPGPRRRGYRLPTDGPAMRSGRWGRWEEEDARGRPAPGGRRAWAGLRAEGQRAGGGWTRSATPAPPRRTALNPARPTPAGAGRGGGAGRACRRADGFRKSVRSSGGLDQPNRLPSAVKVQALADTISSTASSEVWCSYSERSWR